MTYLYIENKVEIIFSIYLSILIVIIRDRQ